MLGWECTVYTVQLKMSLPSSLYNRIIGSTNTTFPVPSVVDRHRSDADPDPILSLHLEKQKFLLTSIYSNASINFSLLSRQCQRCHNFQYSRQSIAIFWIFFLLFFTFD